VDAFPDSKSLRPSSSDEPGLRSEAGFTFIEVLVAMVLGLVVVVGPLLFLVTSTRQQNVSASRASASRQAEAGIELLARDLREAMSQDAAGNTYTVTVSNPTTSTTAVTFKIPTPGSSSLPQTDTWTCPSTGASSVGSCTRTLGASAATKIVGVKSVTFSPLGSSGAALALPATNPSYIGIALSAQVTSQLDSGQTQVAQGASSPILVQTGVDLRNQT
jgi:prepilin-type N-terminal cleavage/methylation domain-containing protein